MTSFEELRRGYATKKTLINERMSEFAAAYEQGDEAIFTELCFCIFTAGASARMGLACIDAIKDVILTATADELEARIERKHRYPKARAGYIIHTRDYLQQEWNLQMKELIESFQDRIELRDFFAANKGIKGIGYKEGSHFLRNIGFKGYAILDKHILRSLHEFGVIHSPKPPTSRKKYLEIEVEMEKFAREAGIDFDDLDLLLWSNKTGEILK
ncbi:N-glycosylase/DNA lyase [Candidatus Poribacteria bacterium]